MSKKLTKGNQGLIGAVGRAYASEGNLMTPEGAASLGEGIEKLAEGYATGIKKVKDAVTGSVTGGTLPKVDPIKVTSIPNPGADPSKGKLKTATPFPKKSAFKYNASLVNAVAKAYGSEGGSITPKALDNLTKPIFSTVKDLAQKSKDHTTKMLALNSSKGEDYSGTNPKVLQNIIDIQADIDSSIKESQGLKGVFTGGKKKAESLQRVTNNEAAIQTLLETNESIETLVKHSRENWTKMSNAINMENAMVYDKIAQGKIWGQWDNGEDVLKYEGGGVYTIENPMGVGRIDIRELDPLPTVDLEYEENAAKGLKSLKGLYTSGNYTMEELEKQATTTAKKLNATSTESKFDDEDFPEFVKEVWSGEVGDTTGAWGEDGERVNYADLDSRLYDQNPSRYHEAHTFYGDEPEEDKLALYANTLKHMDIDKEWVQFKANKYMRSIRDLAAKREQDANNDDPSKALSWEKQQAAKKETLTNALAILENNPTQPQVDLGDGTTAHLYKGGYVVLNSSSKWVYNEDNPPPKPPMTLTQLRLMKLHTK